MSLNEPRLPGIPITKIELDGSGKNLSLLTPESLIERSFIPTTPEQRFHYYDRESLWIEQKQIELNDNENPSSEPDQLHHDMDEIMMNLVENNTKYGTYCMPMGHGESSAVLLLTPIRVLGKKIDVPGPYGPDVVQQTSHCYGLVTKEGFFQVMIRKTDSDTGAVLNEGVKNWEDSGLSTEEAVQWRKNNTHIISGQTIDERYSVSERNFASAVQKSMWNTQSKTRSEIRARAKPTNGMSLEEVVDHSYLAQQSPEGVFKDQNGKHILIIDTYSVTDSWPESVVTLQQVEGEDGANFVRDAIIASRANGEKRIIEPQNETRKQLQVARAILDILE